MRGLYRRLRDSGKTKDFLVFLVFVGIAAVFWYILALNDEAQNSYEVSLRVSDVPDSVTFITEPPARLHVTVRDRGVNFFRYRFSGVPVLDLNFREYADGGRLRLSHASLQAVVRKIFGSTAVVSSISPDSLSILYTDLPGHRVPLELLYDVSVAPGMVLGTPKVSVSAVDVFSQSRSDTLRKIYTDKVVLRNLDRNTTVDVPVSSVPGKRVVPSQVSVTFVVEQLVKKESEVPVEVDNIPLGHDILFFPSKVRVSYYVPMSRYADPQVPVRVMASFSEAFNASTDKVAIRIVSKAPYLSNVELLQDSVEYTVVKAN